MKLTLLLQLAKTYFLVLRKNYLQPNYYKKMNTTQHPTAPTFESVWALLQENAQQQRENERFLKERFAESDRQRRENERILTEKFAETDRLIKESREKSEKDRIDYERRMKNFEKTMGSWANNHGSFAEEYFFNAFEEGEQNFFGEKFNDIKARIKGIKKGSENEYDILLINGKCVCIIEVKFKAREDIVPQVLRKAETLRVNYPDFEHHKIYLGLAAMSFFPGIEEECKKEGIAIIKQVGDTVVIDDGHLKEF